MSEEEFLNRILNKIAKEFGYDVASTLELIIIIKDKKLEEKDKEIDRLNNIINGLEKYLIEHIDEYRDMEQDAMFEFGLVLDKLKELKNGDNNE